MAAAPDLRTAGTRSRILRTARALLDTGFPGIHHDIEPVCPDDRDFLDLPPLTHRPTLARGRVLSVESEQLPLADWTQPVFRALLPRGRRRCPPGPTAAYQRAPADRADQVAIMTYDAYAPAEAVAGRYFAGQTARGLSLIDDRATVFMGLRAADALGRGPGDRAAGRAAGRRGAPAPAASSVRRRRAR